MQERINSSNNEFSDVVVQYAKELNTVGIGLEPQSHVPFVHFVDAIYGEVSNQTRIGALFNERANELGWDMQDFKTSDAEAEWNNLCGRIILDSVTGSNSDASLWTWLDRSGVNRLIRLLRKGRDLAFGRDQ